MTDTEVQRKLSYYRRQLDAVAGENLRKDYEISGLRKEIRYHVRAFALLSELQERVAAHRDIGEILRTVMTSITASLGMDRTVIFRPGDAEHEFRPWFWTGFTEEGRAEEFNERLEGFSVAVPELEDRSAALLVNRDSEATPSVDALQTILEMPFFVGVPVFVDDEPIALILSGRVKETGTVFAQISESDVETFRAITSLVSAVVQNIRVAALEEADRLRTDFFANLSHEFRTPITLSLGPLDGLINQRYGSLPGAAQDQLKVVESSQRRLLRLVNQLLDVAKSESGAMELRCAPVDAFNELVASRVEHFRGLADKRGITLSSELDAALDAEPVYVDLEKFDRAVLNLLSNAHKFTAVGGRITVSTRRIAETVSVSVTDTGVGIPPEQLPHIFDRFRQASRNQSREFAGTGIGLALVKELAELHHGSVRATSSLGQGSTFELRLPLGRAHLDDGEIIAWSDNGTDTLAIRESVGEVEEGAEDTDASDVDEANRETRANFDDGKPTLLVVDDNRQLREYIRGLLVDSYNVFAAADGADGLDAVREFRPDLVVSDLMMPRMNGAEFCRALRADPAIQATPFILLTAKASVEDRAIGIEEGADDYLGKPFSERELKARIRNMIRLRRQELRLSTEVNAAREIQRALLPQWPHRAGAVEIDALYRPCEELSGDFFDVISAHGSLWVYLADVTSHGAAAAQVTLLVKSLVRELLAHERPPDVPALLASAQRRYAALGLDYDVGIQVVRVDPSTGSVEIAGGNAPVALHRDRQGSVSPVLVESGSGLTVRARGKNCEYRPTTLVLDPGESLHLFTDGCVQFSARGRRFGTRRLSRALASLPADGAWAPALEALLVSLLDDDDFDDDVTMLRVSRAA